MAYIDRIRKLERLQQAKNNILTMIWIDSSDELTQEQIDSKNAIYVYLEI
jgi:hypothetical protein